MDNFTWFEELKKLREEQKEKQAPFQQQELELPLPYYREPDPAEKIDRAEEEKIERGFIIIEM